MGAIRGRQAESLLPDGLALGLRTTTLRRTKELPERSAEPLRARRPADIALKQDQG